MVRSVPQIPESSESPEMQLALDYCRLYAPAHRPIVLMGPVGVGKTSLAQLVHRWSGRRGRFVAVSGGELSDTLYHDTLFGHVQGAFTGAARNQPGMFELAAEGTLFFDDITYLSVAAQSALLRILEERRIRALGAARDRVVTSREIFATTVSLDDLVSQGRLIPDLRSRLGELLVHIPPLSRRIDDIPHLARAMAKSFLREHDRYGDPHLTPAVVDALKSYSWPGNLRELRSVIERGLLHAGLGGDVVELGLPHLPGHVLVRSKPEPKPHLTIDLVRSVLRDVKGNKSAAARRLGVHRNTIHRVLKQTTSDDESSHVH